MRGESDTFRFPLRESKASNGEPLYRVDRIFRSLTFGCRDKEFSSALCDLYSRVERAC